MSEAPCDGTGRAIGGNCVVECLGQLWGPSVGSALVELIVALVTYCVSYLPRTQEPLGSRRGSGASQEGINVFLRYPASCFCEVVHYSTLVALYVARLAWAPTQHPSEARVELSFLHIVAIYGATTVCWEPILFHALGSQPCHLASSPIQEGR